ncbi:MAG: AAA family ATPase, partial [Rhodocyclaceae bacterium]|nr:AAA family ATPase [Rhodocyclaceae bacterium]
MESSSSAQGSGNPQSIGAGSANPFARFRHLTNSDEDVDFVCAALRAILVDEPPFLVLLDRLQRGDAVAGRKLARALAALVPAYNVGEDGDLVATVLWLAGCYGPTRRGTYVDSFEQQEAATMALVEAALLARNRLREALKLSSGVADGDDTAAPRRLDVGQARRGLFVALRRLDGILHADWRESADQLLHLPSEISTDGSNPRRRPSQFDYEEFEAEDGGDDEAEPTMCVCPQAPAALERMPHGDKRRFEWLKPLASPLRLAPVPQSLDKVILLSEEMPNFSTAVRGVVADLALRRDTAADFLRLRPLLLVGPPGIGKTRFARILAEKLGLAFSSMSLEGLSDNRGLAGTASGWSSAEACWPLREMARLRCANPLLTLDEIDKCVASHNGDNLATLLSWLEPSTACKVQDPVLGEANLSGISW